MDDDITSLLRKNLEVAKDNNRLLRKMRRSAVIGTILRLIWWSILIGVPVVIYIYFLQPLLNEYIALYQGLESQVEGVSEAGREFTADLPTFPGLEWFKGLFGGE